MVVVKQEAVNNRLQREFSTQEQADQQKSKIKDTGVDIATLLTKEIRSSIYKHEKGSSGLLSKVILDREIDGYRIILTCEHNSQDTTTTLSPREQEIARMVAKGLPNKTIAAVLEISTWTVGTHLRRMFAKFGVNSRAAMVAKLIHLQDNE